MASFFQPAVFDPTFSTETSDGRAPTARFLIYSNSILPKATLLATWYQYVVFIIGAVFFCAPLIRWGIWGIISGSRTRKKKKWAKNTPAAPKAFVSSLQAKNNSRGGTVKPVKSFGMFLSGDVGSFLNIDYDLHIVDFGTCMAGIPPPRNLVMDNGTSKPAPQNVWGLIGGLDWHAISSTESSLLQSIDAVKSIAAERGLSGLVISSTIDVESNLSEILELLTCSGVACILLDDASEPVRTVDLAPLSGVIYKNACILPDGSRRDFFQAAKLRNSLGKCDRQRVKNKNLFVGFLDRWTTRPIPAVVRRAYKFAQFHGAVLSHAAGDERGWNGGSVGNCLSAFDWIKRNDIIQVKW